MIEPVIRTEKLTRTYVMGESTVTALREADLTVHAGEFIALMGASGSGKSTLLNLIGLLDRATSGEYFLEGKPVSSLRRDELAELRGRRIGFIFQNFNLLSRYSAWENVALPLAYRQGEFGAQEQFNRAREALSRVQLEHRIDHNPMELSGGERQRVAIARAILKNPHILIFDEATSALDSKSEKNIQAELKQISENRTTLIIAHRLSTIIDADRILVLDHGRIVESGTHKDLLEKNGMYAHMWSLQQREAAPQEVIDLAL